LVLSLAVEEEEGKKEEKFDFDLAGETMGYVSLEQARVLAMRTAREDPGNYGTRFTGVRMVFDAVEQEEGDDYYIVTLSFRPEGDFAGAPGREQFFIEKEGVVAHRQVLGLPKGKGRLPVPAVAGAIAVVVVVVVVAVVAFGATGRNGGVSPETPETPDPTSTPTAVVVPTATPTAAPSLTPPPPTLPAPTPTPTRKSAPTPTATPRPLPTPTRVLLPTATPGPLLRPTPTGPPTAAPPAVPTSTAVPSGGILIRQRPTDFQTRYDWSAGSVPPPLHYSYTINLGPGQKGEILFTPDYATNDPPTWQEAFGVDEGKLETLYTLMAEQKVFTADWEASKPARRLTGGRSESLKGIANGNEFAVPYWGAAFVREVYNSILALVPKPVWDKLNGQRDLYIKAQGG
jgi:hypothetical protein